MIWLQRILASCLMVAFIFLAFVFILHGVEWCYTPGENAEGIRFGFVILSFVLGGLTASMIQKRVGEDRKTDDDDFCGGDFD